MVFEPEILIPSILMAFGTTVAAVLTSLPRAHKWGWMQRGIVPFFSNVGGFFIGFYSLYFLGSRVGWTTGVISWIVLGFIAAIIVRLMMSVFPAVLIAGIASMYIGLVLTQVW